MNKQFDGATVYPYPQQFNMYLTLGIVNRIEVSLTRQGTAPLPPR